MLASQSAVHHYAQNGELREVRNEYSIFEFKSFVFCTFGRTLTLSKYAYSDANTDEYFSVI